MCKFSGVFFLSFPKWMLILLLIYGIFYLVTTRYVFCRVGSGWSHRLHGKKLKTFLVQKGNDRNEWQHLLFLKHKIQFSIYYIYNIYLNALSFIHLQMTLLTQSKHAHAAIQVHLKDILRSVYKRNLTRKRLTEEETERKRSAGSE